MSDIKYKKSDKFTMFVPAFIDDYGFNPEEFRVFSRIMRRSLGGDPCFESIPNMAKSLQIAESLVRRALNVLIGVGAVVRTERLGKSDHLEFTNCDQWKPKEELDGIRDSIAAKVRERDRQRKAESGYGNVTTAGIGNVTTVVTEMTDEGIPTKEEPNKVIPFSTKTGETPSSNEEDLPPKAESVQNSRRRVFDLGVRMFKEDGWDERTSRSLLGGLIQTFTPDVVAMYLEMPNVQAAANRHEYLVKALNRAFPAKQVRTQEEKEALYQSQAKPLMAIR